MINVPVACLVEAQLDRYCGKYGFRPKKQSVDFSIAPPKLGIFFPYARIWGVEDIDERMAVIEATPVEVRKHVVAVVLVDNASTMLSDWLGGDESQDHFMTDGYVALSFLCQAAEVMESMDL